MAAIRGKDTKPELLVRRLAHRLGFRFRLHRKDLPGRPDLVFPKLRAVIFVHGCFWHQHPDPECVDAKIPKTRTEYWIPKLENNVRRDLKAAEALKSIGWKTMVVWECETKNVAELEARICRFLRRASAPQSS